MDLSAVTLQLFSAYFAGCLVGFALDAVRKVVQTVS